MKKKTLASTEVETPSSLYTTILAVVLATILVFLSLEYFFQIPSRFFVSKHDSRIDIEHPVLSGSEDAPSICTMEYAPVCGIDDKTYGNACMARGARVTIAHDGECNIPVVLPPVENSGSIQDNTGATEEDAETTEEKPQKEKVILPVTPPNPVSQAEEKPLFDSGSYQFYANTSAGYEIALPKYAYYQGYGARDGADHTLAVGLTGTGVESFETADVRVYYYKKSSPEAIAGARQVNLANGGVLVIDGANSTNPKVQKMMDIIQMSAN